MIAFLDFYPLDDGTLGVKADKSLYLSEIVVPATYKGKTVTKILDYGFSGGIDGYISLPLKKITLPNTITSIEMEVFYGDESLDSINIPDSVTSIGVQAFLCCSRLTSMTIPDSVTNIDNWAIARCSSLTSINFQGTIEQWNAISKGWNWDSETDNYVVYCTDGYIAK